MDVRGKGAPLAWDGRRELHRKDGLSPELEGKMEQFTYSISALMLPLVEASRTPLTRAPSGHSSLTPALFSSQHLPAGWLFPIFG